MHGIQHPFRLNLTKCTTRFWLLDRQTFYRCTAELALLKVVLIDFLSNYRESSPYVWHSIVPFASVCCSFVGTLETVGVLDISDSQPLVEGIKITPTTVDQKREKERKGERGEEVEEVSVYVCVCVYMSERE